MGRYYLSGRCLDCELQIGALTVCPRCGLDQTSPDANRLRWLLSESDLALQAARGQVAVSPDSAVTESSPAGAGTRATTPPSGHEPAGPAPAPYPALPPMPARPKRASGWPALSTPTILLGLGAICVLVAAVVFVSVAWSDLSLAAKAAILLTITAGIATIAAWSLRRGLRGSGESLTLLTVVLVVVDFVAAVEGGLLGLGGVSDTATAWVSAGILVAVGLSWAFAAVRTRTRQLTGVQLLASLGTAWLVLLVFHEQWAREEYVGFALVVVLLAAAFLAARIALWTFAVWVTVLAVCTLAFAYSESLGRVLIEDDLTGLWSSGRAVGWVICLAVAACAAAQTRLSMRWRRLAAAVVVVGATLLVLRPLEGSSVNAVLACLAATCALLAASTLVFRTPWRFGSVAAALPTGFLAALLVGLSVLDALGTVLVPAFDPWAMAPSDHPDADVEGFFDLGSPWLVGVAAVVVMAAVCTVLARRLPRFIPTFAMVAAAAGVVALRYSMPLWAVVVVMGALALVTGVVAVLLRSELLGLASAAYACLALVASLGSEVTTAVTAGCLALVLAGLAWLVADMLPSAAAAFGSVLLVGLATAAGLERVDRTEGVTAYALVGLGAVVVLAAQLRVGGRAHRARPGLELGAIAVGCVGLLLAERFSVAVQLPICLTIAGASLVAASLVSWDRRPASIAGGLLLATASWVRLAVEGVSAVEAYTLPTALVLLILGVVRMRRTPGASSITSLAPGLSLALLPSLWAALPEPTSLRALLLGIASLLVLLAGAAMRWIAPLLMGAGVILVLAVINLAPYAAAVPRWVLFAMLGAALLFLGITWERRLRNARTLIAAVERLA